MTTPENAANRKFAKDVATQLERKRRNRRLIFLAVWAALIVAAAVYLRCGRGWGLGGGKGSGTGTGSGSALGIAAVPADAGPKRCSLRVSSEGILVDGAKMTRDEAVAACNKTDGAMVTVTGDARQGDWDELRAALQAVGVKIYVRGELWDGKTDPTTGSATAPSQN